MRVILERIPVYHRGMTRGIDPGRVDDRVLQRSR